MRRDRHRPHRGRPAHHQQRRRLAGRPARAVGRDRARGRRPGPPALDRARSSTRPGRTPASPGRTWTAIAVTYGPGLAGSLLVGINFAKALAWVHDKPLIAVNHLEGHVYAGWLLDPGEDEASRPEPIFPLVALVVSGGHTFLAEMTDHLTYRLLGTTVDDAAGEAFDKVGRLLGLGYPGGPAIQRAAEGATRRDVRFPRAWMGDTYDWSFSGLKTAARRIVTDARAAEGLARRRPGRAPVRGDRGRAGLGLPGRGRRRPRDQDDPGRRGGRCPLDRPRRRRRRQQRPARSTPRARPRPGRCRSSCRDPGLCTDNGAMIGAAGARRFAAGERAGLDLDARPSLPLARR